MIKFYRVTGSKNSLNISEAKNTLGDTIQSDVLRRKNFSQQSIKKKFFFFTSNLLSIMIKVLANLRLNNFPNEEKNVISGKKIIKSR